MLTTVLNDSPVFPEDEEQEADLSAPLLMDSPQVKIVKIKIKTSAANSFQKQFNSNMSSELFCKISDKNIFR